MCTKLSRQWITSIASHADYRPLQQEQTECALRSNKVYVYHMLGDAHN